MMPRYKAIPWLQFMFVFVSEISNKTFVLCLFVPHLSFFLCLGMAMLRDCDVSLVSSLTVCISAIQPQNSHDLNMISSVFNHSNCLLRVDTSAILYIILLIT